mgnify:FL=1
MSTNAVYICSVCHIHFDALTMAILKYIFCSAVAIAGACLDLGYFYMRTLHDEPAQLKTLFVANKYLFADERITPFEINQNGRIARARSMTFLSVDELGHLEILSNPNLDLELRNYDASLAKASSYLVYRGSETFYLCADHLLEVANSCDGAREVVIIYQKSD